MTVIEVQNLQKHYDEVKAVDGISFQVHQGEVFGFLGPNGAGKTTTIFQTAYQLVSHRILDSVSTIAGNPPFFTYGGG